MAEEAEVRTALEDYFHLGYKYNEIVLFLDRNHGIKMSVRTLKEKLKEYGLRKRGNNAEIDADMLRATIRGLMNEAGNLSGYRTIWHALRRRYHVHVSRERVAAIIKELDALGVEARRTRRLQRRVYRSYGPNFCWHMDGYDKLKPYGFPIHGAIDGYSRRIIWLEVVRSNNNPRVPADLFIKSVRENNGCPRLLWSDCGTENGLTAAMQCYFRDGGHDALAGENAHRYGTSPSNQRIEAWWSFLRRSRSNWWMNYFKSLVQDGLLQLGNELHMECLRFCFLNLLQNELNEIVEHWNTHYIRRSRYYTVPGVPNVLYYIPELSGGINYIVEVAQQKIHVVETECEIDNERNDYELYFQYIMERRALPFPSNENEALRLFQALVEAAG